MGAAGRQIDASSVYPGGFDQIRLMREAGLSLPGAEVLELGSGWHPVIPLMLRIAGAARVTCTDVERLMDRATLRAAAAFLRSRTTDLADRLDQPAAAIEAYLRLADLDAALGDLLERMGLDYIAPFAGPAPGARFDAIISHTVLEHVPPAAIEQLLAAARESLKPGGLISHGVDHSDHRAHHDPSLSRIDFLRYSDRVWRLLCLNPHDYTNRLRHADYVDMVRAAGFELVVERALIDQEAQAALVAIPIDARFHDRPAEQLAVLWSHILARPA